jgi:hypothetical protein
VLDFCTTRTDIRLSQDNVLVADDDEVTIACKTFHSARTVSSQAKAQLEVEKQLRSFTFDGTDARKCESLSILTLLPSSASHSIHISFQDEKCRHDNLHFVALSNSITATLPPLALRSAIYWYSITFVGWS